MFRRATGSLTPSAALSAAALTAAGLLAAAPLAQADPAPTDPTDPTDSSTVGVSLLDDLTVLPVQACGVDAGIPILSDVLDPTDAAPNASCAVVDDDGDVPPVPAGPNGTDG
jgi:hypothetical protein